MKRVSFFLLAACILLGVLSVPWMLRTSSWFALAASSEAVHVVAHTMLYGGAALLAHRAGASPVLAVGASLLVAMVQEGVQVVQAGRTFYGAPEAFDFGVDLAAACVAVAIARRARRASAAPDERVALRQGVGLTERTTPSAGSSSASWRKT